MDQPAAAAHGAIHCRVTPWFLLRAVAMLLMLLVFAFLFLKDGMVGYRHKNLAFYSYQTFANEGPKAMAPDQSASKWQAYATGKTLAFPDDPDLLPAGTNLQAPWPPELLDFNSLNRGKWHDLWLQFSAREKLDATPRNKPYDAREIRGQFIAFSVCAVLAVLNLFILLRTLRRSMTLDGDTLTTQTGQQLNIASITRIDMRQWKRKGLAYLYHGSPARRVRIDGMTYGGFKQAEGAPAEALMQQVLAQFHGELVDYVEEEEDAPAVQPADPAAKG